MEVGLSTAPDAYPIPEKVTGFQFRTLIEMISQFEPL